MRIACKLLNNQRRAVPIGHMKAHYATLGHVYVRCRSVQDHGPLPGLCMWPEYQCGKRNKHIYSSITILYLNYWLYVAKLLVWKCEHCDISKKEVTHKGFLIKKKLVYIIRQKLELARIKNVKCFGRHIKPLSALLLKKNRYFHLKSDNSSLIKCVVAVVNVLYCIITPSSDHLNFFYLTTI